MISAIDTSDPQFFLNLTLALVGIGVVLSSLEDLRRYRSFSDDGLQSWRVARLHNRILSRTPVRVLADAVLSYSRFRWLIATRLSVMCLLLTFQFGDWAQTSLLFLLGVCTVAYNVRSPFGLSGDHQMTTIIVVALLFASLVPDGHIVEYLSLWFIAIQGVLSYVIAGWFKLASSTWRSGDALLGIMRTDVYGNRSYYRMLRRWPPVATGTAWTVIAFESLFFLVFANQPALTFGFLLMGALFHLHAAFIMRLNLFFWAFVATYPAIVFCAFPL